MYLNTGSKTQNLEKLSQDLIFYKNFWWNIKSFTKQNFKLIILSIPDRNQSKLTVWNGSKIKSWRHAHHFITTIIGGVILVWPNIACYQTFRPQLMWFNTYLTFVQYLQFTYQKGCLCRLRSLGERDDMDITINGFHSYEL